MSRLKHVLIVGSPRSGTTWTTMLLSQHPQVVAAPQLRLFDAVSHLQTWWRRNGGPLFSRFGVDFAGGSGDAAAGRAPQRLLCRDEFLALCGAFVAPVFEKVAGMKPGARAVVTQTPEDLRHAELIHGVLPEAFFVHVIRDPRSVFASQRIAKKDWALGFPASRVERARLWASDVRNGQRIAELTGRYREIRYEALLADGASELALLFDWLELPVDAGFCEKALAACSLDAVKARQPQAPPGFFRKGRTDGWREELSQRELRLVEYFGGALMDQLGYGRALPVPPQKSFEVTLHDLRNRGAEAVRRVFRRKAKSWGLTRSGLSEVPTGR